MVPLCFICFRLALVSMHNLTKNYDITIFFWLWLRIRLTFVYNSKPFFPVKCLWFCQSFLILNSSLASVSSLYCHCKVKIVRWCYEFLRLSKSGSSECWVSGSDLQNKTVFFCLNGNLLKSIQNDLDKIFINIFRNIKSVPDK